MLAKPLLAALAFVAGAAPLLAQDAPYTDASGEEVFGPGYYPDSPTDAGLALDIGRPAAGFQVTEQALADHFAARSTSLRTIPGRGEPRPAIPLLKDFDNAATPGAVLRRPAPPAGRITATMTAHFVDVGQGAAAILEFPCGVAVIDTGGEFGGGKGKIDGGRALVATLERFFAARPKLRRTIDLLVTSHPHKDHLAGLARMLDRQGRPRFRVRNVVDNGQTGAKGSLKAQTDFRAAARRAGADYSAVELARQYTATGATNAVIDPFRCPQVDPVITAFWGGRNARARGTDYRNPNDHSVAIRVDFGAASLLFLGDLEARGLADLLDQYRANRGAFDADLLHVSHHGSDGDTDDTLLGVVSPEIAIVSMGDRASRARQSAFDYGHPRRDVLDVLQNRPQIVARQRPPRTFWASAGGGAAPKPYRVTRAIHATGWEGTIVVRIGSDGSFAVR